MVHVRIFHVNTKCAPLKSNKEIPLEDNVCVEAHEECEKDLESSTQTVHVCKGMCFNKFMGLQIICTHQLEYLGLSNTKTWWFCGKHATWIVKVDDTVPLMSFQVWNPIQAESLLNSSYFQVAKHPKDPITLTIAMTILKWDSLAKDMMSYATSGGCWRHGFSRTPAIRQQLLSLTFMEPSNIPIFCASPHSVQRPVLASINHPNLHKLHATSSYSSEKHEQKPCATRRKYVGHIDDPWQIQTHKRFDHIPRFFHFQQRKSDPLGTRWKWLPCNNIRFANPLSIQHEVTIW